MHTQILGVIHMRAIKWGLIVVTGGFTAFMLLGWLVSSPASDAAYEQARRQACADAVTSSMGTSTTSYQDKMAYQERVRDQCKGFNIPKHP